jgi:DNA-binding NtrC family response regulator
MNKVLLVEDDTMLRSLLRFKLMRKGWEVIEAENGNGALKLLSQYQVHLVVTDISLPELSGIELAEEIKKLYPQLTIVGITADSALIQTLDQTKFQLILEKPIEDEDLNVLNQFQL